MPSIITDEVDVIIGDWVPVVLEGGIPLHDYCFANILNVDWANCLWRVCSNNGANWTEFPETERVLCTIFDLICLACDYPIRVKNMIIIELWGTGIHDHRES